MPTPGRYEDLVAEATDAAVAGWDFCWLAGRAGGGDPPWRYPDLAGPLLAAADRVLDVDTGGGELLASLVPPPGRTVALEGWAPNVPVATRRLAPLGVEVLAAPPSGGFPVADRAFDLVLSRHGRLPAAEVARVLRPGGRLLTQQVGSDDCVDLNAALDAPPPDRAGAWTLATATAALTAAGLRVLDGRQAWPTLTFTDIGAVVFQLRMIAWQVPDFSVRRYDAALRRLDAAIRRDGAFRVRCHRFLIVAALDAS